MRNYKWALAAIMVATLAIIGCSKKSSVDTTPMEKSFKSAEPAAQSASDKVVTAIKAEDYHPGAGGGSLKRRGGQRKSDGSDVEEFSHAAATP